MEKACVQTHDPQDVARVEEIIRRARQGDESVLPELKLALDRYPIIWQTVGSLSRHNDAAWLNLLAGPDLLFREAIERSRDTLRRQLLGPNSSALESLLVARIISTWEQTMHAEAAVAERVGSAVPLANYLLRRADSSNRRFSSSVKLLALVQRLLPNQPPPAGSVPATIGETTEAPMKGLPITAPEESQAMMVSPFAVGKPPKRSKVKPTANERAPADDVAVMTNTGLDGVHACVETNRCPTQRDRSTNGRAKPLKTAAANGADKPINRLLRHLPEVIGTDGALD